MLRYLPLNPLYKFVESFVDNVVRDCIDEPAPGSVVYCALAMGYVDHSGIYIGNNEIVHLDGSGAIEIVSPAQFLNRLDGWNLAISITVSCANGNPVGSREVASRARQQVGRVIDYKLLTNNCHAFSAGCLSGDFDNWSVTMAALKSAAKTHLGATEWRVWNQPAVSCSAPDKSDKERLAAAASKGDLERLMAEKRARKSKPSQSAAGKQASTKLAPATPWPFPTKSSP